MKKICLLIVFNHKFNRNIPILQKIYGERFSHIYYLVPFNKEKIIGVDKEKIISVYESSYHFQGYFTEAYKQLEGEEYSHYIMIGDDQILNSALNENNILDEMKLEENDSYIKRILPLGKYDGDTGRRLFNNLCAFSLYDGLNYKGEIPEYEEAVNKFKEHGIEVESKIPLSVLKKRDYWRGRSGLFTLLALIMNKGHNIPYPICKGYSDMIIIDKNSMSEFCRLSGIFAAMNLFVENAIPLAMLLSCQSIKYEKDINEYRGVENWGKEIDLFEQKYEQDLNKLFENWDEKVLYYHPIKLSKWKYDA